MVFHQNLIGDTQRVFASDKCLPYIPAKGMWDNDGL